ncbi:hypothetical protein DL240_04190 [Lujinxingia litoralis]|uniref:HTH merR-type domain-containing protein n=2 Tax=Lujinxingia litoralis TaxID=2211119 RepID=A0A328CCT2_9DELT|nr:hypothetical protein DL240_04190 [Lujinxingia litoralis]
MIELPEKTYFKIGEVAKLLEVEPYVLRYWETEFDTLEPEKTKSGQRVYQRHDIEHLLEIRELLYVEMFTIAGARRQLERGLSARSVAQAAGGSAASGDEALLAQLTDARQELAQAEHELLKFREATQTELQEASELRVALEQEREALAGELAEARFRAQTLSADDSDEVLRLEGEVAALRAELEQERRAQEERDEVRQAERRLAEEQVQRRRRVLSQMRREVESLAVLADRNRVRR